MEDLSKHLPLMEVGESVRLQFGDIVIYLDKCSTSHIKLIIMNESKIPDDFLVDICPINVTEDGGESPVTTEEWQDWIHSTEYVPDRVSIEPMPSDAHLDLQALIDEATDLSLM